MAAEEAELDLEALLQAELDELSSGGDSESEDELGYSWRSSGALDADATCDPDAAFEELLSPASRAAQPGPTDWSALMAMSTSNSLLMRFEDELGELSQIASEGSAETAVSAADSGALPPVEGGVQAVPAEKPPPVAATAAAAPLVLDPGSRPLSMHWCSKNAWARVLSFSRVRDVETLAMSSLWCRAQSRPMQEQLEARAREAREARSELRAQRQMDTAAASEQIQRSVDASIASIERGKVLAQVSIVAARAAREAGRREAENARREAESERTRVFEAQLRQIETDRARRAEELLEMKVDAFSRRASVRRAVVSIVAVQRIVRRALAARAGAARALQRHTRRRSTRRVQQRSAAAATQLQAAGRARVARRDARRRSGACGVLRSSARAWIARRRARAHAAMLAARSKEERACAAVERAAAAALQCAARGALARRRIATALAQKARREVDALRAACAARATAEAVAMAASAAAASAAGAARSAAEAAAAEEAAAATAAAERARAARLAVLARCDAARDAAAAFAAAAADSAHCFAVAASHAPRNAAAASAACTANSAASAAQKCAQHAFVDVARANIAVSSSLLATEKSAASSAVVALDAVATPVPKARRDARAASPSAAVSPVALTNVRASVSLDIGEAGRGPASPRSSEGTSPLSELSAERREESGDERVAEASPLSDHAAAALREPMQGGAARALMQRRSSKRSSELLDPARMAKIARDAAMAALRAYTMPDDASSSSVSSSSESEADDGDEHDGWGGRSERERRAAGAPSELTMVLNHSASQVQRVYRGHKVRTLLVAVRYDDGDEFDYEAEVDLADFDLDFDFGAIGADAAGAGAGGSEAERADATMPSNGNGWVRSPTPQQRAESAATLAAAVASKVSVPGAGRDRSPLPLFVGPDLRDTARGGGRRRRPGTSSTTASTISLDSEGGSSLGSGHAAGSLVLTTRSLRGRAAGDLSPPRRGARDSSPPRKTSPADRLALQKEWGFADQKTMDLLLRRRRRMLGPAPDPQLLARQRRVGKPKVEPPPKSRVPIRKTKAAAGGGRRRRRRRRRPRGRSGAKGEGCGGRRSTVPSSTSDAKAALQLRRAGDGGRVAEVLCS